MNERLLASALVHSLYPERSMEDGAAALARQADHRTDALDRALAHLLRRARERPTGVTERAAEMLRRARALSMIVDAEPVAPVDAPRDLSLGAPA